MLHDIPQTIYEDHLRRFESKDDFKIGDIVEFPMLADRSITNINQVGEDNPIRIYHFENPEELNIAWADLYPELKNIGSSFS